MHASDADGASRSTATTPDGHKFLLPTDTLLAHKGPCPYSLNRGGPERKLLIPPLKPQWHLVGQDFPKRSATARDPPTNNLCDVPLQQQVERMVDEHELVT